MSSPTSLEDVAKACDFKRVACCGNCKWRDSDSDDFGYNYSEFCGNPKNEFEDAKPGEDASLNLMAKWDFVCKHHEWEDRLGCKD